MEFQIQKACEINRQLVLESTEQKKSICFVGENPGICANGIQREEMSFDDISLFNSIKGTTIIDPADEYMYNYFLKKAEEMQGVIYLRKNYFDKSIYDGEQNFTIGHGIILKEGKDVSIFAAGMMVQTALEAAEALKKRGVSARVIDPVTIKPLDVSLVYKCAVETGCFVVAENHNVIGGLSSSIERVVSERKPIPVYSIANADRNMQPGEESVLRAVYALQSTDIIAAVLKAIDAKKGRKTAYRYDIAEDFIKKKKHIKSHLKWGNPDLIPEPWISYVVPTFKRPELLKEALISILNQDEVDFQWQIVVSDNETDENSGAEQVVKELNNPRIIYYRHDENLTAIGNWNRSIELARSPWVAMLHADDLVMHDHLVTMARYIKKYEKKSSKPLAYISAQYIEFSKSEDVDISADNFNWRIYEGMSAREQRKVCKFDILQPFTKKDSIITGASVYVPSNGTIMNRNVMVETGGFNGDFGVSTDLIKPLTLIDNYRVYKTMRPMGYYRLDSNATMRPGMLHKIAEGCMKISDYIYQSSFEGKIWKNIAYDERFTEVIDIMMRYSSFGNSNVSRSDFDDIHICRTKFDRTWRKFIYQHVMRMYKKKMHYLNMDEIYTMFFEDHMNATCKLLDEKMEEGQHLFLYGAGVYGEKALSFLRSKGYVVSGFVVTSGAESCPPIEGYPVNNIADIINTEHPFFLITTLPNKQDQIITTLRKYGIENYAYII